MKTINDTGKKVLAFAREAGGASAIAPVCRAVLKEGWNLLLLGKDHSHQVFKKNDLACVDFPVFDETVLEGIINHDLGSYPDVVLTSAASLPALDMTERFLWKWGKKHRITTIGVLDQWQNYALRFSGSTPEEFLIYVPDHIFVMDNTARQEMINEGIPERNILVTGQPAFDAIKEDILAISARVPEIRERLNIHDSVVVMFVGESLRKDFGDTLGYDELSTLQFLGDVMEDVCSRQEGLSLYLVIKLHPENRPDEFEWVFSKWPSFTKLVIARELTPYESIAISDMVVGMTSIMLIESIIAGKPTVSLQINSMVESQLVVTKNGSIPFIKEQSIGSKILKSLLFDNEYRREYLDNQNKWCFSGNVAARCMSAIRTILQNGSIDGK